jgi:hypothetical protein
MNSSEAILFEDNNAILKTSQEDDEGVKINIRLEVTSR